MLLLACVYVSYVRMTSSMHMHSYRVFRVFEIPPLAGHAYKMTCHVPKLSILINPSDILGASVLQFFSLTQEVENTPGSCI